jgi:hypothetical protein
MEPKLEILERGIRQLDQSFDGLGEDDGLSELLKIIHRPGWTSVAELALVGGLVEVMQAQVNLLVRTREVLLTGSREVGVAGRTER